MFKIKLLFQDRIYLFSFVALILLIGILILKNHSEVPPVADESSADTFIPEGSILVPIELKNPESFEGLVDRYAVVDLFETSGHKKTRKIAHRVQLIRAPLNREKFAVLIPEKDAAPMLSAGGPLYATIKNPGRVSTEDSLIVYSRGADE